MIECDRCGFKFMLLYPLGQHLIDGWANLSINCPVCRNGIRGFSERCSNGTFNTLITEE